MNFFAKISAFFMAIIAFFAGLFSPVKPEPKPEPYNIIFMIGDGMGYNHLAASDVKTITTLPVKGSLITNNVYGETTDSAAAGTALACGIKTANKHIGVYEDGVTQAQSLTELAHEKGMKTGVITTDSPYGATPGAFTAHVESRDDHDAIIEYQHTGMLDLLWTAKSDTYWTSSEAESLGYTYVTDAESAFAVENGERTLGEFEKSPMYKGVNSSKYGVNPSLSELAEKSFEILDDENGFFIMIEGAHIDKNSHDNDMQNMIYAAQEFDRAVKEAVDFAKADGHTIVIVTADHETGGLTASQDGTYYFTKTGHTSADVPLYIYGSTSLAEQNEVLENSDFSNRVREIIEAN